MKYSSEIQFIMRALEDIQQERAEKMAELQEAYDEIQ